VLKSTLILTQSQDRTFVNQSQDVPVSIGSSSFATPKSSSRAPRPVSNQTLLEPEYGIYREDDKIPARNLISLSRIEQGQCFKSVPKTKAT
jgi:hypothetical protein